jgi:NAD+ synthase (glutamine-hydrolysing)
MAGRCRLWAEARAAGLQAAGPIANTPGSMRPLRIGLAQLNPTVGDLDGNFERIARALETARSRGVDLFAVPEMAITGYPPEDLLLKPSFIEGAIARTRDLLPLTRGLTAVIGTVERDGDLFDSAAVLHDGEWMGTYRKHFLPNYGVFDENRYFMAASSNAVFARGPVRFGVSICEDIWFPGGPIEEQVIRGGAEVIVNISASPYHAGKAHARRRMMCTRAADNLAVTCYVNMVGGQDEIVFDGASLIVDEQGRVLAEGRWFEEDFVVADVDLDAVFNARLHDPRLRKGRVLDGGGPVPTIELKAPAPATSAHAPTAPVPEPDEIAVEAEVYRALVLGTRDYVRKCGFEKVVLGLSGGIDSALTAVIAADALGAGNVVGVSMPSRHTSKESREDAEALANNLGMSLMTIPIESVFEAYRAELSRPFEGRPEDTTEENLQARIRGNYLMALSNKFGWLVLTTGNKSEVSVGYATLYGDMAGGFAVLKDVYKTMVYPLARLRNQDGAPIPEHTLTRPPSAELRPGQTDQDSLPPYDVLDPILKAYVEEDRSAREIATRGHDEEVVRRVVRMVDAAEYKRRQSPPGIKISPRAFGKDRRLPIVNRWRG